jgi:hypothetical protein
MTFKTQQLQFVVECNSTIHYLMAHHWVMTKFQDEVLSLISNYESKRKCQAVGPNIPCWKLQDPKWTMSVVNNYKSPGMMKWDFDLVLGLINWQIINPKIWWSMLILGEGCMHCYFLRGLGGRHVAYRWLHHHNIIETQGFLSQNGGRGKKKSLCVIHQFTF